jgi:hypothetical protein
MSNRQQIVAAALVGLSLSGTLAAQVEIDRRRPAPPKGEVRIDNAFGSVAVKGWDRAEVLVQGTVAAGADGFDFDSDKEGTSVSVSVPDAWFQAAGEDPAFRTTLTVFVPAGSSVGVETVNAGVSVEGVNGELGVETVNGGVKIAGARSPVEVETMTGAIEIQALSVPMELSSISGTVTVDGASGEVQIETVSGRVSATGEMVSALGIKTTTGPVDFRGSIARAGEIDIETFSSPVKLRLPKTTRAVFDLRTFGAKIQSQFCTGTPVTRERFEPFRELRCSTGPDEFEIRVRTHDADIVIEAY